MGREQATATTSAAKRAASPSSQALVLQNVSRELVFAVVGHVGSGTSEIAEALMALFKDRKLLHAPGDTAIA